MYARITGCTQKIMENKIAKYSMDEGTTTKRGGTRSLAIDSINRAYDKSDSNQRNTTVKTCQALEVEVLEREE